MKALELRYVWEWPVRLTHWFNVISIIVLSVTGFYIGDPFVVVPSTSAYVMGWMRYLHFVFAYVFSLSWLVRIIWMFIGNKHARFTAFAPWASRQGWKNIVGTFCYYTFLKMICRMPPGIMPWRRWLTPGCFCCFWCRSFPVLPFMGSLSRAGSGTESSTHCW